MKKQTEPKNYVAPVADKNYRMSKPLKRLVSLMKFKDIHARNAWKRMCIVAEVAAKHSEKAVYDKPISKERLAELASSY